LLGLVCSGCQLLGAFGPADNTSEAEQTWRQGQEAMRRGEPHEAIALYQQSLQADPGRARTYLSLADAHLENGDEAAACPVLAQYVAAHPEQLLIRAQYAELLLRLQRLDEARAELECAVTIFEGKRCLPYAERLVRQIALLGSEMV